VDAMTHVKKIREKAESYYLEGDFGCSETVLKLILENFKNDMPEEILSMTTGFRHGIGGSGCLCGALSGGTMALGLFFGRSAPKEEEKVNNVMKLSKELHGIFKMNHKITCCRILIKKLTYGSPEHRQQCARFVGEVIEETAKIIIREKGADILKGGAACDR